MSTTSSSAVGPVSDRSHPRPQATDSVLAPEVAQDPLLELVLAEDPDAARRPVGHPREEALDQVQPGAVPGRGHELEAARDGGQVAPRLGGGMHRDVAGHDPRQVAPRVLAVRDPGEPDMVGALVRLARKGGRLAGRQVDRGKGRERPEPPAPVVAPDGASLGARSRTQAGGRGRRPRRGGGTAARRASLPRCWGRAARDSGPSCGARSARPPRCHTRPTAAGAVRQRTLRREWAPGSQSTSAWPAMPPTRHGAGPGGGNTRATFALRLELRLPRSGAKVKFILAAS